MSTFGLRLLALCAMGIDHVGLMFFPQVLAFRLVGRMAMPLCCFLLVQGYKHTRHMGRYALRLGLLAVVSEVPYDWAFFNMPWNPQSQNVVFTLLLGFFALWWVNKTRAWGLWLPVLGGGICCIAALGLRSDYHFYGVLLCLVFYAGEGNLRAMATGFCLALSLFILYQHTAGKPVVWMQTQLLSIASLVPIYVYNGKRGYQGMRWLIYAAYPLHLVLFALVRLTGVIPAHLFG